MRRVIGLYALCLSVCVFLFATPAYSVFDPLQELDDSMQGMDSISYAIRNRLKGQNKGLYVDAKDWKLLLRFYSDRYYRPIWHKKKLQKKSLISRLIERLESAPDSGLKRYELKSYDEYRKALENAEQDAVGGENKPDDNKQQPKSREKRLSKEEKSAWYELAATELLFIHARSLASGQHIPVLVDKDWHIKPPPFDAFVFLKSFAGGDQSFKMLDSLEPRNREYLKLKEVLQHYRERVANGGWPKLPVAMPTLKPGMESKFVPALRKRLQAEKPFDSGVEDGSQRYDKDLVKAVMDFQGSYGLKRDGIVGRMTRKVLNIPMKRRIQSVVATMERWRWMPRNLGSRYILVNLPSYYLTLYDQGRFVWGTRVINGSKKHPSPSINMTIRQVKMNPMWHVPNSIAVNELIPKQLEDPEYLSKHGYSVVERGTNGEVDPYAVPWEDY